MNEEDQRIGIIVTLGLVGMFIYPLAILCGVLILGVPFGLLWLKRRWVKMNIEISETTFGLIDQLKKRREDATGRDWTIDDTLQSALWGVR